jgi:hypothetical protein
VEAQAAQAQQQAAWQLQQQAAGRRHLNNAAASKRLTAEPTAPAAGSHTSSGHVVGAALLIQKLNMPLLGGDRPWCCYDTPF